MKRTTVVVPCFNEAGRIRIDDFRAFARRQPDVGFIMVDDGSTDATLGELQKLEAGDPSSFRVIHHEPNRGKAESVRRGVLEAMAAKPEFVGYWDADLATPLEEIPRFLEFLEERPDCQFLLGARVLMLGRAIERSSLRHYAGRIVATTASLALRLPVYDTQCGAKLFRANEEVCAAFDTPFIAGWTFDVEVLARLARTLSARDGALPPQAICEIPLFHWRDVPGSKVKTWDFFRAQMDLLRIHWRYVRGARR